VELRAEIDAVIARENARYRAATLVANATGSDLADALTEVDRIETDLPGVGVEATRVGGDVGERSQPLGRFDENASGQLLLFVFLTSLSGAAALIQTRQWGVSTRMLATPTSATQILLGEALGRYLVALTQAVYIVVGTVVLFGVRWGDPLGVAAVIASFCLVSAAAAMLLGAALRNDAQANGLGILLALALAAMGGSMAPMEVLPDTMQRVGHLVTPHAWGNDAFAELVRRGGGLEDVLLEVAVLSAAGVVLLALASRLLHRSIVRS
jgi:ABC-2 type transport system permease protein